MMDHQTWSFIQRFKPPKRYLTDIISYFAPAEIKTDLQQDPVPAC
jgi:hypothetical protein